MRLFVRQIIIVIVIFGCGTIRSEAQNVGAWSLHFPLPELSVWMDFPEPVEHIAQLLEEEQNNPSHLKAWVYAAGIDVSIEPHTSGQWDTIPEKGYVWRIGIHAENALSLNLFIENYKMQPGMTLHVYDQSKVNFAGPFDDQNNANGGVLPVQSLPGDRIIVEWNIPLDPQSPSTSALPFSILHSPFSIKNVGYGFRDMTATGMVSLASAANCNVDVNCKTGNHWQREKRSVVRMETITRTANGTRTQYCTGTLVNQAVSPGEQKPYILTANHCISTNDMARNTTFVFEYEKAYCDGTNPSVPAGISGSNLVAYKWSLDFALLELSRSIPITHRPYYAGWNTSSTAPQGAIGIHHPQGDTKKIAVATSSLGTGTFTDEYEKLYCDNNAHWIVRRWNEGVTEPGSSGSPIFDAEHKIVGLLSGGAATCNNPVNDYYSKFSEQWNKYPEKGESLKLWLDPDNKGITSLWGYDPLTDFDGKCDTLGNIGKNEIKTLIESGTKGYLTSRNDRNWISFAEKIMNDSIAHIIGMEVHVADVFPSGSKVQFAVWTGNDFPITTRYAIDLTVPANFNDYPMHIYFDETLKISGNYFIGYSLENSDPEDNFSVYQSAVRTYDGVSSMYTKMSNGPWTPLHEQASPINSSLGVRVMGSFGKQKQLSVHATYRYLKIISQPNNDKLTVLFDLEEEVQKSGKIECYDTSGKRVLLYSGLSGHMEMYDGKIYLQVEIDVSILPPGLYLLRVVDANNIWSGKFIRLLY